MEAIVSFNGQTPLPAVLQSAVFRHSVLQQDSTATVFIDRYASSAITSSHISERKAVQVQLYTDIGNLTGVGMDLDFADDGLYVNVVGLTRLLVSRTVGYPAGNKPDVVVDNLNVFRNKPAGLIIERALDIALAQHAGIDILKGTFYEGPPLIDRYVFENQTIRTIVDDMYTATAQEYKFIDSTFSWIPSAAPLYSTLLVDGNNCIVRSRNISFNDQAWRAYSTRPDGFTIDAEALHNRGIWSKEIFRTSEFTDIIQQAYEISGILTDQTLPVNVFRIDLLNTGTLWKDIREGMSVMLVAPKYGIVDVDVIVRVLSRSYQRGSDILTLEVQYLPKPELIGLVGIGREIPRLLLPTTTTAFNLVYQTVLQNWSQITGVRLIEDES